MKQTKEVNHNNNHYYARARICKAWVRFVNFMDLDHSTGLIINPGMRLVQIAFIGFLSSLVFFAQINLEAAAKKANGKKITKQSNIKPKINDSKRKRALKKSLGHQKRSERLKAIKAAKKENIRFSKEDLKTTMQKENDALIRLKLQRELVHVENSTPEVELIQSLKNDLSSMVRQGAAQSLGNYVQSKNVVEALVEALKKDTNKSVRRACALSLAISKRPLAIYALIKASSDSDPVLRRQVAFGLKRHNTPKALKTLAKMKKDSDPDVRKMAGAIE